MKHNDIPMTETISKENMNTSKNENVEEEVKEIAKDIFGTLARSPEERRIIGQTLQLLAANGSPLTPNDIAVHLLVSQDKVTSLLRSFGAEFDEEGNILGVGLTLVPTSHIYKVNDRKLYTWCAADALVFHVVLKQSVHIESSDPVTGNKVQIHVTPDRVERIEPKSAIVSFVKNIDATNVRRSFCSKVNFFSSPETAALWIVEHPDTTVYPVDEVFQALKQSPLNIYDDINVQSKQEEGNMCC
jgi:alkylmercury lyase